jgi:hypothetical protein
MHHEELTAEQARDLRALAGAIIPPSRDYGVPGADDELIFNDILRSLERDTMATSAARWLNWPRLRAAPSPTSVRSAAPRWPPPFAKLAARRLRHWSAWYCFATIATTG